MALSGSVSTNGCPGEGEGRYYTLSWSATQSISNNTSTISWTLSTDGGYSSWMTERTVYVDIDGERVFSKTEAVDRYRGTIATGTKAISHNSDGTRSFSVSLGAAIYYSSVECTGSQTFTLDTIARASTLSVSDGTLGTKTTLTADRKSSSFTHTLTWECGSYSGTLATKSTSTSWPFTPELQLASVAPYGQKVYCTYTLSTYNGSTLVGTDSKSAWFAIPSSVKPSCTLSLSDSKGYASTYGGYIQGESQLSVTINATQAYGSPISRYSASANGTTYSTRTFTTSVLTKVGTNTISATVTDGRERPGSVSSNITVLAYSRPQITNLKVRRCNADGTENDRGGYGKISFHCTITPLSNKNDRACSMQYRQSGTTEWISAPTINLSAYDQDCNPPVIQMSDAHSYEVQINLTDAFGTASAVTSISTGYCLYHIPASGKGITFGGIAEGDEFNVKMDATFGENVNMKKNLQVDGNVNGKYLTGTWLQTTATTDLGKAPPKVAVLDNSGWIYYRTLSGLRADLGIGDYVDLIYPVGSIYMSVNATNPKNLFGGTWEQIQGRFLLGMSSSYPAGSQGGEATHTLTANEMPNHTHQYIDYWTVAAASGTGRQAVKFNNNNYSPESGGLSTGSSGGGKPHNNMPPYLAVYIWKRTA